MPPVKAACAPGFTSSGVVEGGVRQWGGGGMIATEGGADEDRLPAYAEEMP